MFVIFPPAIDSLRLCLDSVNLLANAILLSISLSLLYLTRTHILSLVNDETEARKKRKKEYAIKFLDTGFWTDFDFKALLIYYASIRFR